MEFILISTVFIILLIFPIAGGCTARSFGRKFWLWLWIFMPFPFITPIILISLPDMGRRISPLA